MADLGYKERKWSTGCKKPTECQKLENDGEDQGRSQRKKKKKKKKKVQIECCVCIQVRLVRTEYQYIRPHDYNGAKRLFNKMLKIERRKIKKNI